MMKTRAVVLFAVLALVAGCASMAQTNSRGSRSDTITADEIAQANVSNLYEVVQRLRPRWLEVRSQRSFSTSTEIVVYQGQSFLGGVEMLRQIGPEAATLIRYLDGSTASATLTGLGSRQVEGAIVINPTN